MGVLKGSGALKGNQNAFKHGLTTWEMKSGILIIKRAINEFKQFDADYGDV
jgi:hypothetical protein